MARSVQDLPRPGLGRRPPKDEAMQNFHCPKPTSCRPTQITLSASRAASAENERPDLDFWKRRSQLWRRTGRGGRDRTPAAAEHRTASLRNGRDDQARRRGLIDHHHCKCCAALPTAQSAEDRDEATGRTPVLACQSDEALTSLRAKRSKPRDRRPWSARYLTGSGTMSA